MFCKNGALTSFATFTGKQLCQSLFISCNFIENKTLKQGFEFCKIFKKPFLKNTTRWMLLFCDSCWLYSLRLYIAGNFQVGKSHCREKKFIHISQRFYRFGFLLHIFFIFFDKCVFTLSVTQSVCYTLSNQRFVGSETPKHNAFDQFWKFKFHFEHFPRN